MRRLFGFLRQNFLIDFGLNAVVLIECSHLLGDGLGKS
jgi:hypothetical protein